MTTQHLREELERIADAAPTVDVAGDTWTRGRRSLARTRLLTGAAAVAVVAVVVGLVTWPELRSEAPVADSSAAGLPDHLYDVPHGVTIGDDLAVGQAAAAWVDQERPAAVLVGAADGAYHLLRLPGLRELMMTQDPTVALSPDGRHLAWGYGDYSVHETGIRVADLDTGDITTTQLEAGEGVSVAQLAFSPDGRWLAWSGAQLAQWDSSGASSKQLAVGRLDVESGEPETLPFDGWPDPTSVGVDDDGVVFLLDSERLFTFADGDVDKAGVPAGRVAGPLVVDAASGSLATGVGGNGPVDRPAAGTGAVVVPAGGGTPVDLPSGSAEAYSTALAWVGDDVLTAVSPLEGSNLAPDGVDLTLVGPGHEPRVVGHADPMLPEQLSVAADLVTPEQPTVERAEPDWPWSTERKVLVGGGVVLGLLVLLAGAWVAVRRRRLGS